MSEIDLSKRQWKLQGWRPFYWQARKSIETGGIFSPEFGPYEAKVPGSVHAALRASKIIPDWNIGVQSLDCEWVEHRHWEFFTEFKAGDLPSGENLYLCAEGLDYSGWIVVDCQLVASFKGALIRHRFELSRILNDGKPHRLSIIFDTPPEEQGQIGRTSLSRFFKPRFSFSWDWCVRFVPIGIWDALYLECGDYPLRVTGVTNTTSADLKSGCIQVGLSNERSSSEVEFTLRSARGGVVTRKRISIRRGNHQISLRVKCPKLWWPNGEGEPHLYDFEAKCKITETTIYRGKIGFKHVRWLPCAKSPKGARNLLCEVNGRTIFLQGVNWTPVQMDYPATSDGAYRRLVGLYAKMGCNVLRVWGGAFLEKEVFYQLCDEAGLMVWQEFPLCSAGRDSDAPRDKDVLKELCLIATDYVRRRRHHASLLLWCGGNELQSIAEPGKPSRPLNESHPALAALKKVVEKEQPGISYFPTSPSGPVFFAKREEMGKGLHHHVHGPWDGGGRSWDYWEDYWTHDDSLLRTETGVSGTSGVDLITRYAGKEKIWPPSFENKWWRHSSAWWLQWNEFEKDLKCVPRGEKLARFVKLSQKRQAEYLAFAAKCSKQRFPCCSGFLIWMGHDAFPCAANTSIIDFEQRPKLAYRALKNVFCNSQHIHRSRTAPASEGNRRPAIIFP